MFVSFIRKFFNRFPTTAPFNSIRGMEVMPFGAILPFAIISRDQKPPLRSCQRIYATAPYATAEPSENTTSEGRPTTSSSGQRLRGNETSCSFNSDESRSTHFFLSSSGKASSHPSFSPHQDSRIRSLA